MEESLHPSPQHGKNSTALESGAIRVQLDRLLAHPLFANSKRYPALLSYVVEQSLSGHGADLKERTLGIEVFKRDPDYDANADPIVRITAGEVRKRLAQYYIDPSHAHELLIDIPAGGYQAYFHLPHVQEQSQATEPTVALDSPKKTRQLLPFRLLVAGALGFVFIAGLALGIYWESAKSIAHPDMIARFWAPLTSDKGIATFCLGEPALNIDAASVQSLNAVPSMGKQEPLYFRLHYAGHLALADVITLTRTTAQFEKLHKEFRVLPASQASFQDLREGPDVLIGGFDNLWTLRLTQHLRFGFESKDGVALLVDRKSPNRTSWATAWDLPYQKLSSDYAIVVRMRDTVTGQPVIIAAGISEEGTEAAGEVLYKPEYLNELLKDAPNNWEQMNMEAVIETQVIEGHSGPPRVLAAEYW